MNIDLIKKLTVNRESSSVLIAELENCDRVIKQIDKIKAELSKEYTEHNKKIIALQKKLSEVESECHHPVTTYYSDPSGGSDSSTICDVCNKEIYE